MSTLDALPDRVSALPREAKPLAGGDLELLAQAHEAYRKLEREIGRVIIGQEAIVRSIVAAVFSQGHTLIIGVPGLAKTLLGQDRRPGLVVELQADSIHPRHDAGRHHGHGALAGGSGDRRRSMRFVPGPLFANLILADEINRTPPKTQSALLEAMQEQTVTSMGKAYRLAHPFIVFATQNPIEQEGTYPLPEAQLDRFMFSLWMGYPSREEEENIVLATTEEAVPTVEPVCTLEQMTAFQHLVRRVPVSRHVVKYAVALARSSRPDTADALPYVRQYVSWGAGPRASQHMILGAKALAVLDGEPTVSAKHIRQVAPQVLRHRVLPNYNAAGEGVDSAAIIRHILEKTVEPNYGV